MIRIVLSFFLIPALAGLAIPSVACVGNLLIDHSSSLCGAGFALFAGIALPIAYGATLFFGVPLFLLFRHFNFMRWWQVSLGGAIVGAMSAVALHILDSGMWHNSVFVFGPIGFFSSLVFWFIAIYRNHALQKG